jgi:acetolactate synthase-1/2/3 large subunit
LEKKKWAPLIAEQIQKVSELWRKSNKPVLALGLSAVRSGIEKLVLEFAEKYNVPVVVTPMAKGIFPEKHPLYAGVLFHALSNIVAETYAEADLVVGIGYDTVEFAYEEWMPNVPLIHIDSQEADIDSQAISEVLNISGSIENAIKELMKIKGGKKQWDVLAIQKRKERLFERFTPDKNLFGPTTIVQALRDALPEDGILTVDVGAHLHLVGQQWFTPQCGKLIITNGWSGMGFAIPAAMAAKLCSPNTPVVALMGDGGFAMMAGELATAKRLNLHIVFVVIYDNSLSLIRIKQAKRACNDTYGTDLKMLNDEPTNHYFGVRVERVSDSKSYKSSLTKALNGEGPVVIEAVVDGTEYDELLLKAHK